MTRRPPCSAFTLVEMLVVMAIIAILTGIILSLNGMVQSTGARSRAAAEIKAMAAACEAYKADNGGYPQGSQYSGSASAPAGATDTDKLDSNPASANNFATFDANPNDYTGTSIHPVTLFLWQQLSGHLTTTDSTQAPTGTNYAGDFFKPSVLSGTKNSSGQITAVSHILDPFGNPYGYSTAGLYADQQFRANVLGTNGSTTTSRGTVIAGFNPTFDLWSTGGATTTTVSTTGTTVTTPQWVKNW
jgi:prepilin-type N-terminal cleavage/methylation domain-containing protein